MNEKESTKKNRAIACFVMTLAITTHVNAAQKKLKRPVLVSVEQTDNSSVDKRWDKADNARKYELFVSVNGGKFKTPETGQKGLIISNYD